MGYRSNFKVTVAKGEVPDFEYLEYHLHRILCYNAFNMEGDDRTCAYDIKWYDCERDMGLLSEKFPGVLLCCYIDGEDSDDFRKVYAIDGKTEELKGEVVFPRSKFLDEADS